jgi:hypothetical protein
LKEERAVEELKELLLRVELSAERVVERVA